MSKYFCLAALLFFLVSVGFGQEVPTWGTINHNTCRLWDSVNGEYEELWDLTKGPITLRFRVDLTEMVDDFGGSAHAWAEFGIREICQANFNPQAGKGVWLATDYDWTAGTFNPDPPNAPTQDIDDKLILQRVAGQGEQGYNINGPGNPWLNYGIWFDRDGVDQWQATNWGMVDGVTYNTNGRYQIEIRAEATDATHGVAYMTVNGVDQGFYDTWRNGPPHHTPSGMTFTGDMTQMQVFFGLYGYGASHYVTFSQISITGYHYNPTPIADFTATPTKGIDEVQVQFTNLSKFACSYNWWFGDGTSSEEKNPIHTYTNRQKYYTVVLVALPGATAPAGKMIKTNYIQVSDHVEANFNATPIAGLPGLNVKFSTVFIGNAGHFIYDFGDGNVQDYFGDFRNIPAPSHLYQEPGEYDVTLMAHGSGGRDTLTIPNLVYIDPTYDYLDLTLVQGGAAWPGEGWDNAIDHDTYGANSILAALPSDASGVFIFADSLAHDIYKLRLLTDTVEPDEFQTQYLKEFELFVSDDGLSYTSAFKGTCVKQDGAWDLFVLPAPVRAKYLKLTLLSARHPQANYIELAEFQVFGTTAAPLAKADLKLDVPTQFNLTNYPNPFNPETTIRFELPEAAQVKVAIYNMQGQLIRNLVNAYQNMGYHNLTWDARDDQGATVAGGVYVAKLLVTGETQKLALIRKLVFMK